VAGGVELFSRKRYTDMKSRCSCPDWLESGKHVRRCYYLRGEEFDRDTFLIFRMAACSRRGVSWRCGAGDCGPGDGAR